MLLKIRTVLRLILQMALALPLHELVLNPPAIVPSLLPAPQQLLLPLRLGGADDQSLRVAKIQKAFPGPET